MIAVSIHNLESFSCTAFTKTQDSVAFGTSYINSSGVSACVFYDSAEQVRQHITELAKLAREMDANAAAEGVASDE